MSRRTLAIGDIHGGFRALEQVLERANIHKDDRLIFLGDYVDGWSESPQVIDFLMDLSAINKCIFIRGNHDELCLEWLKNKTHNENWLFHGGRSTLNAYNKVSEEVKSRHIQFMESLENYFIDKENRLFLHAGFTNLKGVEHEYFPKMFYWDRSLWEMALAIDPLLSEDNGLYPERLKTYKEIFIGHTPTTRIGKTEPVNAANVWNLDTGAAYKSPLTIMDVETKQFWQSDNLNELYPDEKGRN